MSILAGIISAIQSLALNLLLICTAIVSLIVLGIIYPSPYLTVAYILEHGTFIAVIVLLIRSGYLAGIK